MALCVVGIFVIMFRKKMAWRFVVHTGWIMAGITSVIGFIFAMQSVEFGGKMTDLCNIMEAGVT